jgi:hypothetical protein
MTSVEQDKVSHHPGHRIDLNIPKQGVSPADSRFSPTISSPLGVAPSGPRGRSPQVAEGDSEAVINPFIEIREDGEILQIWPQTAEMAREQADPSCDQCHGSGIRHFIGPVRETDVACNCVIRRRASKHGLNS